MGVDPAVGKATYADDLRLLDFFQSELNSKMNLQDGLEVLIKDLNVKIEAAMLTDNAAAELGARQMKAFYLSQLIDEQASLAELYNSYHTFYLKVWTENYLLRRLLPPNEAQDLPAPPLPFEVPGRYLDLLDRID